MQKPLVNHIQAYRWASFALAFLLFPIALAAQEPDQPPEQKPDQHPSQQERQQDPSQPPDPSRQEDPSRQQDHQSHQQGQHTQQQDPQAQQGMTATDDTPRLGVMVLSSPGGGVLVTSSMWGSPAHSAGIRNGDYITLVNDTAVSSAEELRNALASTDAESKVKITLWRNGETFTKEVQLARRAEKMPDSHRTWLGIVLTPSARTENKGVEVSYVFPNSPAQNAGLQAGDVILKAGDKDVENIEALLECMEHHGPDSGCRISVDRNGEITDMEIKMGDISTAPVDWLIQAFRAPMDAANWTGNDVTTGNWNSGTWSGGQYPQGTMVPGTYTQGTYVPGTQVQGNYGQPSGDSGDLREMIQQLRQEVQELRSRLDAMEGNRDREAPQGTPPAESNRDPGGEDKDNGGGSGPYVPGISLSSTPASPAAAAPVQDWYGRTQWGGSYYYPYQTYYYPQQYYQHYHYGYPQYRQGYYPNNNGWYYNYGGTNWYNPGYQYNGNYYGPRYGVRVGNNWGLYWY